MTAVEVFAPAKINLTLHVTGQRDDGYHLLDSLVVFVDICDRLQVTSSDDYSLSVTGPMSAGVPDGPGNLCLAAARLAGVPVDIVLEKHLPLAAGIGGGSSDAAAVLLAIEALTGAGFDGDPSVLGADVPVCLGRDATRMRGIGDILDPVTVPELHAVLVNPGVGVSTPAVFKALLEKSNSPMQSVPRGASAHEFCAWLREQRNDLEAPAIALQPVIGDVLKALSVTDGVLCHRMSGSGATCFGLYENPGLAERAASDIRSAHPTWWVQDGNLRSANS